MYWKKGLNLNNTYYETLYENFNEALNLIEKPLSHNELIELLETGNIPQKQLAALRLDTIKSTEEGDLLLNNLTGQDGKIREAVSLKIEELMNNQALLEYFFHDNIKQRAELFLAAITDINGNICRNIISAIKNLKNNTEFCKIFSRMLTDKILKLIENIDNFDYKDKKYKTNKVIFQLYWCLEALNIFYENVDFHILKSILLKTKDIDEYTIREKTAKILSTNFEDKDLQKAKVQLKNDTNYYVRRF